MLAAAVGVVVAYPLLLALMWLSLRTGEAYALASTNAVALAAASGMGVAVVAYCRVFPAAATCTGLTVVGLVLFGLVETPVDPTPFDVLALEPARLLTFAAKQPITAIVGATMAAAGLIAGAGAGIERTREVRVLVACGLAFMAVGLFSAVSSDSGFDLFLGVATVVVGALMALSNVAARAASR
ncbi:hypothetical protein [Nocardioides aequoreus]|uniref:hypothetical protein n=1 Tax=Nocardioides aequoreus TaxID=397278 RepID=UPI0004C38335|nr:hypothetical protein [Nocardioides aequoreus]